MLGRKNKSTDAGGKPDAGIAGEPVERKIKPPFFSAWQAVGTRGLSEAGATEEQEATREKRERDIEAPGGTIHIENYCPVERLEKLSIDDGILMFSRSNHERQKKALVNVAGMSDGNVIAGTIDDLLVAYIGIHRPTDTERWGKPGYPWLYELGAIEVSRNYRRLHLADAMLDVAFGDPYYDDKIVLTMGFTWHWDFEGTGMDRMKYRQVGIKLMGGHGFMEMATDEPNVVMDPANLFLVRIGKNAPFSSYQKFSSLLFTNEWEAMLRGL